MAQKARSSVVIFHSSICDFSQFSCDFYSSVLIFENIRASKSRKAGVFEA